MPELPGERGPREKPGRQDTGPGVEDFVGGRGEKRRDLWRRFKKEEEELRADREAHRLPGPPRSPEAPSPPGPPRRRGSLDRLFTHPDLIKEFSDTDVKEADFEETTKRVAEEIEATPDERAYLRLLRLWRRAQPELQTLRTNPRLISPEEPRAIRQGELLKEPDVAAILDPIEVREAIADLSYQIKRGRYDGHPKWKIFGEGYQEMREGPLFKIIALQFLDSWLVHPDPTVNGEVAQWVDSPEKFPVFKKEIEEVVDTEKRGVSHKERRGAFRRYQAAHDGVWNQYPVKRWPELGESYGEVLPHGEEFNLMIPAIKREDLYDPERNPEDRKYDGPLVNFGGQRYKWDGRKWYMGDYFKWAGFTPEELVDEWDEGREGEDPLKVRFRRGEIKGFIAYYWQIRRAYNTSVDLSQLLTAEKKITPLHVRARLGGRYDYLGGDELNWMRRELIRPWYGVANDGVIAELRNEAAEGKFPRLDLYKAVTEKGLFWMDFKETLGDPELGVGIDFAQIGGGAETPQMQMQRLVRALWRKQGHAGNLEDLWEKVLFMTGIDVGHPRGLSFDQWHNRIYAPEAYSSWRFNLQVIIDERKKQRQRTEELEMLLAWDPAQRLLVGGIDPISGEAVSFDNSLWGLYSENNYRRLYGDYFDRLHETGGTLNWRERAEFRKQIRKTYEVDQGLTHRQYEDLLKLLDKVPKSETAWQYLRSPDWLVHHRWPTLLTVLSFVPEMFTFGRWQREKSGVYNWIWKWLGVSPAGVFMAGVPWLFINGFEAYVAGQAAQRAILTAVLNTAVNPVPHGLGLTGVIGSPLVWMVGMSWALTYIDKFWKFTKRDYDAQKLYEAEQRPQH